MKQIYQGALFVAFLLVAIYGVGTAEAGGSFFIAMVALLAIAALMGKAGMMAKPLSKEKYEQIYGRR